MLYKLKKFLKIFLPLAILIPLKNTYNYSKSIMGLIKYHGNHTYCPCCEKSFAKFKDFQFNNEEHNINFYTNANYKNSVCPYCFSLPRHRIICDYLSKNSEIITKNRNILIFAAERSICIYFKKRAIKYTTADLFDTSADLKIDIQNTYIDSNVYDFIICNHVLEHVLDFKKALKELYRILKPGGKLEITVPIDPKLNSTYENTSIITPMDRKEHFGQIDHCRIFGIDFAQHLILCGFNVKIVDGNDCDIKMQPVIGPAHYDYNKIFICTKYSNDLR
jgi:SAM-dependent methyltransferase